MVNKIISFGINGIDAFAVDVEADLARGLPAFDIVGIDVYKRQCIASPTPKLTVVVVLPTPPF